MGWKAGESLPETVDEVLCCFTVGALHAAPISIINELNRVEHVRPYRLSLSRVCPQSEAGESLPFFILTASTAGYHPDDNTPVFPTH